MTDLSDKKEKEGEERPTVGSFGMKIDSYTKKMMKVQRICVCMCVCVYVCVCVCVCVCV